MAGTQALPGGGNPSPVALRALGQRDDEGGAMASPDPELRGHDVVERVQRFHPVELVSESFLSGRDDPTGSSPARGGRGG